MGFNDEYKKIYDILDKITKKDEDIEGLKELYKIRRDRLKREYNRQLTKLYSEEKEKEQEILSQKEELIMERDYSGLYNKLLYIRLGDLRKELANYLGIDTKEVKLYAKLETIWWPKKETISKERYDMYKNGKINNDELLKVYIIVKPDSSKEHNYDVCDVFAYKLNYSMPQADGISLVEHMYKKTNINNKIIIYEAEELEDTEVEELYLKIPFHLLFTDKTSKEFQEATIKINDNDEYYHYVIREQQINKEEPPEILNAFRQCAINCLKKEENKNKKLTKKNDNN